MARVVHFEIPADNPERAIAFYKKVFSWDIQKFDGPVDYWLVKTGPDDEPGINGGILKRPYPSAPTTNTIGVQSLEEALKAVEAAGGKIEKPKMGIPGVGWLAYCSDPEGNMFGLLQPDPSAK